MIRSLALFSVTFLLAATARAAEIPQFEARTLDPHVGEVCYAVTVADVDGDKKPDLVAVTENRVVWYHNPDWKMRVIIEDQTERDNVCIAPLDVDGDGKIDFALGAGWLNNKNLGTLHWLTRGDSLDEKWKVHAIGRESWTHRIKWGDVLGTGKPQLIVSPLNKTAGEGVRVLAFSIPANPRTDAWKSEAIDESLNAMHAHWTGDFDGDGKTECLTASMEGVFLFKQGKDGKLARLRLGVGMPGPKPESQKTGAGEIKVGKLKGGKPFIATVEPMHGNAIVVYTPPSLELSSTLWTRHVLDETLKRGHAVGIADLDGDGLQELVIGHSDPGTGNPAGPGVFIYKMTDESGTKWTKHVLDNGGISTEDLVVEDFNGDGFPDIAAGGRATHNVKLYVNRGK